MIQLKNLQSMEKDLCEKMEQLDLEQIEIHDPNDAIIVHQNGQMQTIHECWCKLYHYFGNQISTDHVWDANIDEDIRYMHLSKTCPFIGQLPFHQFLFQKLELQIYGPVIFYRKGKPITIEMTQKLFSSSNCN